MGGQDFTIDGWIYPSQSLGSRAYVFCVFTSFNTETDRLIFLTPKSDNGNHGGMYGTIGGIATDDLRGKLSHFACVYRHDLQKISLYINGNKTGESDGYSDRKMYPYLYIGRSNYTADPNYSGAIDEFRISDGIARWTENFTPPTKPYTHLFDGVKYPIEIPTLEDKTYMGEKIVQGIVGNKNFCEIKIIGLTGCNISM